MSPAWTEVNITPKAEERREDLLFSVVEPVVHGEHAEYVKAWFFFWEGDTAGEPSDEHLRLRILWKPSCAADGPKWLAKILNDAQAAGDVKEWWEGCHGIKGETYQGEAENYGGAEAWEVTYRDWQAGSELALLLVRQEREDRQAKPRSYHWRRRAHLFADQLLIDDIRICLLQAQRYMDLAAEDTPEANAVIAAIDRYLYGTHHPF